MRRSSLSSESAGSAADRARPGRAAIVAFSAVLIAVPVYLSVSDRDGRAQLPSKRREANLAEIPRTAPIVDAEVFDAAEAERLLRHWLDRFYSMAQPGGRKGDPPYAELVAELNSENVPLFLELLERISGASYVTERARLQLAIAHRWASFDRRSALQYAMGLPPRTRNSVLSALVVSWAQLDRESAWRYVQGTLDLHAADSALNVVAELLASAGYRDPAWVIDRLKSLPAGRAAEQATERFFAAQSAVDVERASAWVDQLPAELHDHALHAVLMHYGASDPQRALEAFAELALPANKLDRSASRLTSIWAAESPLVVAEWTEKSRGSPLFPAVASTLAERWTYENPAQAGAWLNQHREDEAYLPALKSHLAVLGTQDPSAAKQWIDSVQNAENRGALLAEMERLGLMPPSPTS